MLSVQIEIYPSSIDLKIMNIFCHIKICAASVRNVVYIF